MIKNNVLVNSLSLLSQKIIIISIVIVASIVLPVHAIVVAATQNATASARISFTFDDGLTTAVTQAAPALAQYGLKGTSYVITNCVGMTTQPNTCHADTSKTYMTWDQITALQNTYGWEIGSHTASHPYLASSDASDGQPNLLTLQQVRGELTESKKALNAHGFAAESFSTPYGDYDPTVLSEIAKVYSNHRGFADVGINTWPYNEYLIKNYPVEYGVSVAQVKSQIDQTIASNGWLVLTFHDIKPTISVPANNTDTIYDYQTSMLKEIAAYVQMKKAAGLINDQTISKAKVTGTNLLAGGDFASGLTNGWRTDSPTVVTVDTATNGSFPTATNSIKFSTPATGRHAHLFSPTVNVSSNNNYLLRSYVNVRNAVNGGIVYYIDEYDLAGNWISGQYKAEESSVFTENLNMFYTPSSVNVAKMSVQVIGYGSTLSAYIDNIELVALTDNAAPPRISLLSNGDFEKGLTGWQTDNTTQIMLDSANHGSPSNPNSSISFTAGTTNSHLFSSHVQVTSDTSYTLSSWLNLTQLSSRSVGFYIDEYDAGGNWVSGQYKADAATLGVQEKAFTYTPSSALVATATLQIIIVGGSGATGYIDNVVWYKN